MTTTFIQALFLSTLSWVAWKFFQRFFGKTTLDNIPGPPSQSFWKGKKIFLFLQLFRLYSVGAFSEVFNVDAWTFRRQMAETCMMWFHHYLLYPTYIWLYNRWWCRQIQSRIWSMFKILLLCLLPWPSTSPQENQLYIFDPKALHHIIVKVIVAPLLSMMRVLTSL